MPIKAYKYRIYPNKECQQKIDSTIETCRRLYNRLLGQRLAVNTPSFQVYMATEHPENIANFCWGSHGYPLTKKYINRYDQQVFIKEWKVNDVYLQNVYANSLISIAIKVDNVMKAFFDRYKKKNKGLISDVGRPRFANRDRYNSFTYESGQGFKLKGGFLELSKIGLVKIMLHREIQGRMKTCTIKREGNKYYAVFSCDCEKEQWALTGLTVGIDLGITNYIVTSDGEMIKGIKPYRNSEWIISHLQKLRANKKQKRGSRKSKELKRIINLQHQRVSRQRLYYAQNIASQLLKQYDTVIYEDLQIKNMVKNHHLSKSINDAGWKLLINALNSKASMIEGKQVIAVDPKNTSQQCSECGEIVKKTLAERWHKCPKCGLELDRDHNASINIMNRGLSVSNKTKIPIERQADETGQYLMFA